MATVVTAALQAAGGIDSELLPVQLRQHGRKMQTEPQPRRQRTAGTDVFNVIPRRQYRYS